MTCDSRFEQLSAFTDGELTPTDMAELTQHLMTCPSCAQTLAELSALRSALAKTIPEGDVSEEFLSRISARLSSPQMHSQESVPGHGRVVPFKKRLRPPNLLALGSSLGAAAIAATVVFTLMRQPDNTVDLAAVRDAALRTSLASNDVQGAPPAPVAGYNVVAARKDIVAGHKAWIVTYQGATGSVTLCSWSANGESAHGIKAATYRGTKILYWNDGTTEYWASSSAFGEGLNDFVKLVHKDAI